MRLRKSPIIVLGILGLGLLAALPFRHRQSEDSAVGNRVAQDVLRLRAPALQVSPVPKQPLVDFPETTGEKITKNMAPIRPAEIRVEDELDRATLAPDFSLSAPTPTDISAGDDRDDVDTDRTTSQTTESVNVRHVIHDGETLHSIAAEYYGDEQQAFKIYDANRDKLSDPDLLPLGIEIDVPGAEAAEAP